MVDAVTACPGQTGFSQLVPRLRVRRRLVVSSNIIEVNLVRSRYVNGSYLSISRNDGASVDADLTRFRLPLIFRKSHDFDIGTPPLVEKCVDVVSGSARS